MAAAPNIQEDLLPEQILQAATQLYRKHGLKKVTMDDVSKVIGKSRSSIYYYYRNKDEIFEAVLDALIREVMGEIENAVNKAATLEEKICAFCFAKIKTSEEKKSFFKAIEAGMDADDISNHTKIISDIHKRLMKAEASLLKKALSAAARNEDIRALKSKEQDTLIFILLSSIRGIKREMIHENSFSKLNASVAALAGMAIKWLGN